MFQEAETFDLNVFGRFPFQPPNLIVYNLGFIRIRIETDNQVEGCTGHVCF